MSSMLDRLGWATAAIRHAGWWLEWQTRVRSGDGSRAIPPSTAS